MEVYDAAAKAALVQQLELGMDGGGQQALATAHEDRPEEEMALVNQPLGDRLASCATRGKRIKENGHLPVHPLPQRELFR